MRADDYAAERAFVIGEGGVALLVVLDGAEGVVEDRQHPVPLGAEELGLAEDVLDGLPVLGAAGVVDGDAHGVGRIHRWSQAGGTSGRWQVLRW